MITVMMRHDLTNKKTKTSSRKGVKKTIVYGQADRKGRPIVRVDPPPFSLFRSAIRDFFFISCHILPFYEEKFCVKSFTNSYSQAR